MKTSVVLLLIVFYCLGLGFVLYPKYVDSKTLVALSDDDMMKRLGGQKRAKLVEPGSGNFANCAVSDEACNDVRTQTVTYNLYGCRSCVVNAPQMNSHTADYKGKSSCKLVTKRNGDSYCKTEWAVTEKKPNCNLWTGEFCPGTNTTGS